MHNSNIVARGKAARSKPAKHKFALTVKAATVALKCAKTSLDSDEHDTPTSMNESDGRVP